MMMNVTYDYKYIYNHRAIIDATHIIAEQINCVWVDDIVL